MIFINIIGIGILAIFLLFVSTKKEKRTSDYFLILSICLFACMLLSFIWAEQGYSVTKYFFQIIANVYFFPSVLIYGLLLIADEQKLRKSWLWIPSFALIFTIYLIVDFSLLSDYNDLEKLKTLYESPPIVYQFFYKIQYVFVILSLGWFITKIKTYRIRIKSNFSHIDHIDLKWLRNFAWAYIVLHIISLIFILAADFNVIENIKVPFGILFIGVLGASFYLSYHGIKHYAVVDFKAIDTYNLSIAYTDSDLTSTGDKNTSREEKYKTSSLSQEEMENIFKKIIFLFENDKIYLEPQLKIDVLAKQQNVSTHKVSQTINSMANEPFYDFVNRYRVEHFKELLSSSENRKYTILALGIESGFNSKASLNRIFKEYVGLSPKQFQKGQF